MTAKRGDKDAKAGKKDEPTKASWKKKVEDLPRGAQDKDKAVKGGGAQQPQPPDSDYIHGPRAR
jgi:hypothetical protein